MATTLIEAHGMCKRYGDFALQDVSFAVRAGETVGFIGQNGAGKSTTIKALLGLIALDDGQASVLGVPAQELSTVSPQVKEDIGVVFDSVSLPDRMKVVEVGRLMARAYGSWDARAFDGYLTRFGLDLAKPIKELSRGMGMKLSLACALAHDPKVLIMDEATAGLDPMARDEVLDMLRGFVAAEDEHGNPVHAVLMSTHITSDLERIADEVMCIDSGRMVFRCSKDEITDMMGMARCRAADMRQLLAGPFEGAALRVLSHEYGTDVLVPDRFEFARAFPQIPCDRMTIDDYMAFRLKGVALYEYVDAKKGDDRP